MGWSEGGILREIFNREAPVSRVWAAASDEGSRTGAGTPRMQRGRTTNQPSGQKSNIVEGRCCGTCGMVEDLETENPATFPKADQKKKAVSRQVRCFRLEGGFLVQYKGKKLHGFNGMKRQSLQKVVLEDVHRGPSITPQRKSRQETTTRNDHNTRTKSPSSSGRKGR